MSTTFSVETTIDWPQNAVWETLTDWANAHRWMPGIESMTVDGETAEGATITFHARGKERSSQITRCEPGRLVTLQSIQGGVTADYTYELHRVDDRSTRVTLVAECKTRGLLWAVASPVIGIAIKRADGPQLEALKRLMEAKG